MVLKASTSLPSFSACQSAVDSASNFPFFGNGDITSFEDYRQHYELGDSSDAADSESVGTRASLAGVMIARGALVKPWVCFKNLLLLRF